MRTPLGPTQSVLIRGASLFQGLFYMHEIRLGPHTVRGYPYFRGVRKARSARQGSTVSIEEFKFLVPHDHLPTAMIEYIYAANFLHNSIMY